MRFGPTSLHEAKGAVLAHTLRLSGRVLKKGSVLQQDDVDALRAAGMQEVIAAVMEPGDVPEDEAAHRIAEALMAPLIAKSRAATGRVNLLADAPGLLVLDTSAIDRLNALDESLTIATLPNHSLVTTREMLATIKIIPFAVPGAVMQIAEAMLKALPKPVFTIAPLRPLKVGLVMSELPGQKESAMEGAVEVTRARIEALNGSMLPVERAKHETSAIADALNRLRKQGAEMFLVAGASAVVDRRDVAPAAIQRAGGRLIHFGMPVDPGNLLCLGAIGDAPAIVLPGCAKSPKMNGFDLLLHRLFAGLEVTGREVMRMGVGGLLKEISERPLPRDKAPHSLPSPHAPRKARQVAAVVMAAGRSRRMAPLNKLLVMDDKGVAMVTRVVDQALASLARPVIVVTGHERERVQEALAGRPVIFAHAEDYAQGLSASLRAGLSAVPAQADGVLVCLGDMPLVSASMMDRLLAAFDPEEGRAIVQPTFRGKQGNPMLWGREFIPAMMAVTGDVGARHLVGLHADRVVDVEMPDDGVLRDFDTTEALQGAPGFSKV
ncbi:4-diphosphocytidyl-2C-methyl-D-erythritol kinase [Rhodovarius crocodyli]|uniref:4-diphosphocytidyl-2C-methyl-D-erythritol kinase n=1 Tax=Rhodovarius crocodyli TaxID=1979269 RepID=A0A437MN60_9PROT|nr:molybdopterin-binding/glycosyltransferase family 2 protein [Rhodovarius crocodyli]RVT99050.1 4-diphosphocytidyl-2C-methyl-D-erythritol kinase [Rhodovarius crocodyli]